MSGVIILFSADGIRCVCKTLYCKIFANEMLTCINEMSRTICVELSTHWVNNLVRYDYGIKIKRISQRERTLYRVRNAMNC